MTETSCILALSLTLLVACAEPPRDTPTDAGPETPDAAPIVTRHHFVVNAWTYTGDALDITLDGETSPAVAVTEARGTHEVTLRVRSGLSQRVAVRLYCDGVGVASGPGLPPPAVSETIEASERTYVWGCP